MIETIVILSVCAGLFVLLQWRECDHYALDLSFAITVFGQAVE
ncbi:hypothetical protein [Ponticaulis koreensis]|nr:hypothetical protein [Ponticaulis koreensis]